MKRPSKSKSDWRGVAERFATLIPRSRLHPTVLAFAAKQRKTDPWAVAFSGGADSLALLLLLWAHWPERRDKLVVLHFNHRLRGRESNADERFCRKVCAALGVAVRVGHWAGRNHGASETEARAARHAFFAAGMKAVRGRLLWLAHQQDDVAETLLMRMARGSGTSGLAAPRPVHAWEDGRVYLRPLLGLKKRDLIQMLRRVGAVWREDSSNVSDDYFRNRVRRWVLPLWEKASARDALAGAALSRELLEEDDTALEFWADQFVGPNRWNATSGRVGNGRQLAVEALKGLPRGLTRRVLHRWLKVVRPDTDLSRQGFAVLLDAVERGAPTRFSLGRKHFAVIKGGIMTLKRG